MELKGTAEGNRIGTQSDSMEIEISRETPTDRQDPSSDDSKGDHASIEAAEEMAPLGDSMLRQKHRGRTAQQTTERERNKMRQSSAMLVGDQKNLSSRRSKTNVFVAKTNAKSSALRVQSQFGAGTMPISRPKGFVESAFTFDSTHSFDHSIEAFGNPFLHLIASARSDCVEPRWIRDLK
jgi:hypothetical protein